MRTAHEHDDDHARTSGRRSTGPTPHESPWQMTVPLRRPRRASRSSPASSTRAPAPTFGAHWLLDHWLEPVFTDADAASIAHAEHREWLIAAVAAAAFAARHRRGLAYWIYIEQGGAGAALARAASRACTSSSTTSGGSTSSTTRPSSARSTRSPTSAAWRRQVDRRRHPRAAHARSSCAAVGTCSAPVQTGRVQAYAAMMVVGAGRPRLVLRRAARRRHGRRATTPAARYVVTAAPGLGYAYRWDADGDGEPETDELRRQGAASTFSSSAEQDADVAVVRRRVRDDDRETHARAAPRGRASRGAEPGDVQRGRVGSARRRRTERSRRSASARRRCSSTATAQRMRVRQPGQRARRRRCHRGERVHRPARADARRRRAGRAGVPRAHRRCGRRRVGIMAALAIVAALVARSAAAEAADAARRAPSRGRTCSTLARRACRSLGAVALLFLPRQAPRLLRGFTLVVMLGRASCASLLLLLGADDAGWHFQYIEDVAAERFGIRYHVAVDGISLWLVLLTTFTTPIAALRVVRLDQHADQGLCFAFLLLQGGDARRVRRARPVPVLRVLGADAGADVPDDRRLGRRRADQGRATSSSSTRWPAAC